MLQSNEDLEEIPKGIESYKILRKLGDSAKAKLYLAICEDETN